MWTQKWGRRGDVPAQKLRMTRFSLPHRRTCLGHIPPHILAIPPQTKSQRARPRGPTAVDVVVDNKLQG